ncbi:MAG: NUDIX hydrolase [Acholeplasmataceae bacterium]|jgi:ADP-ribose pyrophosphatase|nr:NUDIX hydrolase [Acholeplasmataceae bacterium]
MKEITKTSVKKYTCSFLSLHEDDVILDNHQLTKRVVIKHIGGACVLPITQDHKVILTKQFRYPIRQVTIEIPAGKKDTFDEDSLICAKRELEEETGYVSNDFKHVYVLHPCLGYSDEKLDIYIALNCYKLDDPKAMDADEQIEIMILDKIEVQSLLDQGLITDGKTLIALQYFLYSELL